MDKILEGQNPKSKIGIVKPLKEVVVLISHLEF